jgi:predicted glycoside hydrolase/deacetylase ChbG (UPF0249 family)
MQLAAPGRAWLLSAIAALGLAWTSEPASAGPRSGPGQPSPSAEETIMTQHTASLLGFLLILLALAAAWLAQGAEAEPGPRRGKIRLLVRGDDIGSAHAVSQAFVKCYREGILRSAEVMVPCPWFEEAARVLNENPAIDVGVHLTLTSEWDNIKWRPLTHAPSLMNKDGYFYQMTVSTWPPEARWPAGTAFMDAKVKTEDVEKELRAQIELARRKIRNVTHLSAHMGTATCRPELRKLVARLAKEYGLITGDDAAKAGLKYAGGWGSGRDTPEQRAAALAGRLSQLEPGTWLIVEHPGLDTPEMRALGHKGSGSVSRARWGVTTAFTSPAVKKVIKDRGIELITYADLRPGRAGGGKPGRPGAADK